MSENILFKNYTSHDYVKFAEQTANWIKTTGKNGKSGKLWLQSPDSKENFDDYPMLTPKSLYGGSAGVGLFYLRLDRKSTRLNSSHLKLSRMPSSA